MIGNCEKCPLPEIKARMESSRIGATTAAANAQASSSPSEAEPWQRNAVKNLSEFKKTQAEYTKFVNLWDRTCPKCEFGA